MKNENGVRYVLEDLKNESGDVVARLAVGVDGCRFKVAIGLVEALVEWDKLTPWPNNYNNGDVEKIAESLAHHGQFRSIVVNSGELAEQYPRDMVLAGNHTYMAAGHLEWTHMAVGYVDASDDEAEEIGIADNAIAEQATPDRGQQIAMLERIQHRGGLERTGISPEMLQKMRERNDIGKPKGTDEPAVPEDVVIEIRCSYNRLQWFRETLDSWSNMKDVDVSISG